jgi:hypothetical protein
MATKNLTRPKPMAALWLTQIRKLKTVKDCREFAEQVKDRDELVTECRLQEARVAPRRKGVPAPAPGVEMRIYSDMCTLERLEGTRLSRSWQMIANRGYVGAVENVLSKYSTPTRVRTSSGFRIALKHGRLDCTYEQTVLDYPKLFSKEARAEARRRLNEFTARRAGAL